MHKDKSLFITAALINMPSRDLMDLISYLEELRYLIKLDNTADYKNTEVLYLASGIYEIFDQENILPKEYKDLNKLKELLKE